MTPGKHRFTVYAGSVFDPVLTWKIDGAAVDLSGYTARMQVRDRPGGSLVMDALTTENGGITLGGVAGTIALFLAAPATALLGFSIGAYDLELIPPAGEDYTKRLLEGYLRVAAEVTR